MNQPIKTVSAGGEITYLLDGKLHRDDGPAVIDTDGERWYFEGKLHRIGGPCISNSSEEVWARYGKRHRVDGPAFILKDEGIEGWFTYDRRHRVGGPAITRTNGTQSVTEWYWHGKRHRDDGPSITDGNDTYWHRYGKLHRLDGPARRIERYEWNSTTLSGCGINNLHKQPTGEFDEAFFVNGIRAHTPNQYKQLVARWTAYTEVTRNEIKLLIGDFRIVE